MEKPCNNAHETAIFHVWNKHAAIAMALIDQGNSLHNPT